MTFTAKRHSFVVTGTGDFPIDMLRYDSCYPNSADAVHAITYNEGRREVELTACQERHWQPTYGRWESFGWKVIKVAS